MNWLDAEIQPYTFEYAGIAQNPVIDFDLPVAETLLAVKFGQAVRFVGSKQAGKGTAAAVDAD